MTSLASATHHLKEHYWPLIKSRQTFLLTLTGVAGYLCQPPSPVDWPRFVSMAASLLISISGSSVLNMLFDRDIDRKMSRTSRRPLPSGQVETRAAAILGAGLILLGLAWAATLSIIYFTIVLAGAALNVLVYTLWLKRRTAWSILWGGLAGGMPILAGRTASTGKIDLLGLLLSFAILCWIPSHNLTLAVLYAEDYRNVSVPTIISVYGITFTRIMVMVSSLVASILLVAALVWLRSPFYILAPLIAVSVGQAGIALLGWLRPSSRLVAMLFKYSSWFMLLSMSLLAINWI